MAYAHPPVVSSQIWNWNASQVSTNSRAHQDLRFTSWSQYDLFSLVENGFGWELMVFLVDFLFSQSSDEDWSSVPDDLKNFLRRQLCDINFHICISIVSSPTIEPSNEPNSVKTSKVEGSTKEHSTQSIYLGSTDVTFVLIMNTVLIEPIINGSFEVNVITEVSRSGGGREKLCFFGNEMGTIQIFISSSIVL